MLKADKIGFCETRLRFDKLQSLLMKWSLFVLKSSKYLVRTGYLYLHFLRKKQSIANGYALFLVRVTRLARRFHRRHAHVGENSPPDCFLPHSRAMLPPFQVSPLSEIKKQSIANGYALFLVRVFITQVVLRQYIFYTSYSNIFPQIRRNT